MSGLAPSTRRVDGAVQQAQHQELLLAMNQLLDQQRTQAALMEGMREEMTGVKRAMEQSQDELRSVQNELRSLKYETKKLRQEREEKESSAGANVGFSDRVDSRFDGIENRQRYHEMILKNREWKYPHPIPSEDYFVSSMKNLTCSLKHGTCDGKIEIYGPRPLSLLNVHFSLHWKEFTDAIAECKYASKCWQEESCFGIYGVTLPIPIINMLRNALKTIHFNTFCLQFNNFGHDGIDFALNYFRNNHKLKQFGMMRNEIDHEEAEELCEIIKGHPSINSIRLVRCFDGLTDAGHDLLCSIMAAGSTKLKHIEFDQNIIATEGSTFIADFLAKNNTLESLTIDGRRLDDEDMLSLASALKKNTSLRFLHITGSSEGPFTRFGLAAMSKAEFDPTTLNSAADSNHTCHMNGLSLFNELGLELNVVRGKKIYNVLSSRHRNGSSFMHLDSTPIELLPRMLSSIQQYWEYAHPDIELSWDDYDFDDDNDDVSEVEDIDLLSFVFEIMRKWDGALSVYECLSGTYGA